MCVCVAAYFATKTFVVVIVAELHTLEPARNHFG